MAEMTLVGLDVSVTKEEIKTAVAKESGCAPDDVTVGVIKNFPRRIGFVWVKCPLAEANILEKKKKIKKVWASVKINLLPVRRMQCFKCLKIGHTKARCDSDKDKSGTCYNCGQKGHKAITCKRRARCVLCEEAGSGSDHKVGDPAAPPSRGRTSV